LLTGEDSLTCVRQYTLPGRSPWGVDDNSSSSSADDADGEAPTTRLHNLSLLVSTQRVKFIHVHDTTVMHVFVILNIKFGRPPVSLSQLCKRGMTEKVSMFFHFP